MASLRSHCFLWLVIFCIAFAVITSNEGIQVSGEESMEVEGRSLKVHTDDYGRPESNQSHQPKPKPGRGRRNPRSLLSF